MSDDARVGLYCTRSLEMAVGFLAVLKAGGACVPLDPAHPRPRLRFIADDSDAQVVLTEEDLPDLFPPHDRATVVMNRRRETREPSSAGPAPPVPADSLAYVLYTSGSTGRPKGVALTHAGLVNHALAMSRLFELGTHDRVLQFRRSPSISASRSSSPPGMRAGPSCSVPPTWRPWAATGSGGCSAAGSR